MNQPKVFFFPYYQRFQTGFFNCRLYQFFENFFEIDMLNRFIIPYFLFGFKIIQVFFIAKQGDYKTVGFQIVFHRVKLFFRKRILYQNSIIKSDYQAFYRGLPVSPDSDFVLPEFFLPVANPDVLCQECFQLSK